MREREAQMPPPKVYEKIVKSPSRPHPRVVIKKMPACSYEPQEVGIAQRTLLMDPVYIESGVTVGTSHWIDTMADHQRNFFRDTATACAYESLHPAYGNS